MLQWQVVSHSGYSTCRVRRLACDRRSTSSGLNGRPDLIGDERPGRLDLEHASAADAVRHFLAVDGARTAGTRGSGTNPAAQSVQADTANVTRRSSARLSTGLGCDAIGQALQRGGQLLGQLAACACSSQTRLTVLPGSAATVANRSGHGRLGDTCSVHELRGNGHIRRRGGSATGGRGDTSALTAPRTAQPRRLARAGLPGFASAQICQVLDSACGNALAADRRPSISPAGIVIFAGPSTHGGRNGKRDIDRPVEIRRAIDVEPRSPIVPSWASAACGSSSEIENGCFFDDGNRQSIDARPNETRRRPSRPRDRPLAGNPRSTACPPHARRRQHSAEAAADRCIAAGFETRPAPSTDRRKCVAAKPRHPLGSPSLQGERPHRLPFAAPPASPTTRLPRGTAIVCPLLRQAVRARQEGRQLRLPAGMLRRDRRSCSPPRRVCRQSAARTSRV